MCIWREGAGTGGLCTREGRAERTVSFYKTRNSKCNRPPAAWWECPLCSPGKSAMLFSYSLLSPESLNKCLAIIPIYIYIYINIYILSIYSSKRNRRQKGAGRPLGKSGTKAFKMPSTPILCLQTDAPPRSPSTHCQHLPAFCWLVAPPASLTPLMAVVKLPPTWNGGDFHP